MDVLGLAYEQQQYGAVFAVVDAAMDKMMAIVDAQLQKTGAYISGSQFTLADIVTGLSVQRWMMMPIVRPQLSAVTAYYELLSQRPAFLKHGRNGLP